MGNDISLTSDEAVKLIDNIPDDFDIESSGIINEHIYKLINLNEKLDKECREQYLTSLKNESKTITLDSVTIEALNNTLQKIKFLRKEIKRINKGGKPTDEEIQHASISILSKLAENEENEKKLKEDIKVSYDLENKLTELMNKKKDLENKNAILKKAIQKLI